jgi:tagatose-1,6-bisphosphate aldolase
MALATAQLRAYQQICDRSGRMLVVAMDQRASMRKLISGTDGEATAAQLVEAKLDLVRHLGNEAPGVLLDPETVVPQVVDDAVLAPHCALVIGMDATGFDIGDGGLRESRLVAGVDAARIRALGGTAAKLNVYLRPDREGTDGFAGRMIAATVEDCAREDVLLVVEILTYALPDESADDYRARSPQLVVQAAAIARACGAQVMKLQYPGSLEGCQAVTAALDGVPWAVLSAGVDHATFLGQLRTALAGGASGAIAGRSLWKDCLAADPVERARRLREVGVPRLREIQAVLRETAS